MVKNDIYLGDFLVDGPLLVGDPCYSPESLISIDSPKHGIWYAVIERKNVGKFCGTRNIALMCYHENYKKISKKGLKNTLTYPNLKFIKKIFGVDSGQSGVFVESTFNNDSLITEPQSFIPKEPWYSHCCQQTLHDFNENCAGIVTRGVVSSSGYGDGTYNATLIEEKETKEIIGIVLHFIE